MFKGFKQYQHFLAFKVVHPRAFNARYVVMAAEISVEIVMLSYDRGSNLTKLIVTSTIYSCFK